MLKDCNVRCFCLCSGQHTIKVDARKQAVKDLSGGSSGASGGNGGAGGSDQQNTLSDESASAITKREANPNHLLSPQYIDVSCPLYFLALLAYFEKNFIFSDVLK